MASIRWGAVVVAIFLCCGGPQSGVQGVSPNAADASPDSTQDASPNSTPDASADPCATQGCGPAPPCGTACGAPCGCCACPLGDAHCQGNLVLRCSEPQCYSVVDSCPSADTCVDVPGFLGDAFCARSKADCPKIASAYEAVAMAANITPVPSGSSGLKPGAYNFGCAPADCGVIAGHCELGLGACWYLGRPQPELDRLASLYTSLHCSVPMTCQCPAAQSASCETNPDGGSWNVSNGVYATYACVVP